jgi:DNA-directed RNA polymerase beta' subunit
VDIRSKEIFKGDSPEPFGIYDKHMGTTEMSWACDTCKNIRNECPGHPGMLRLNYPLKSPHFRGEILKWLKILCFKCARVCTRTVLKGEQSRLLSEYVKICDFKKVEQCPYPDCMTPRVIVAKDEVESFIFNIKEPRPTAADGAAGAVGDSVQRQLFNHEILNLFQRVSNETVKRVAATPNAHPSNYIMTIIRVPPNTIRPDIKKAGSSIRSQHNDLTVLVKHIADVNFGLTESWRASTGCRRCSIQK